MPAPRYADIARKIIGRIPRAGATRLVLIDGPAGAGKTTFARELAKALGAPIVSMDDLIPGWAGLSEGVPRLMEWIIEPLLRGENARYRIFDWETSEYGAWVDVGQPGTLIVEGVSSASRIPARHASFIVWLDAPWQVRLERGLERDGESARGRWELWMTEEQKLFVAEDTERSADIRIVGV